MNLSGELAHIRKQVFPDNITTSCSGEGCQVYLTDIPAERVIINVEKEFDTRGYSRKRCDRLLFYDDAAKNRIVAVPIELKRGKAPESDVCQKVENTLEFAADLTPEKKKDRKIVYVPALFHKRGIKWTTPKRRQQNLTVNFQGKTVKILIGRCGKKKNLNVLLSKAGYL